MKKWDRLVHMPCLPLGNGGTKITGSKAHLDVALKGAEEGLVLLKNDGTLPFNQTKKVALFGIGSYDSLMTGGGSGEIQNFDYCYSLYNGIKFFENKGEIEVFDELAGFYFDEFKKQGFNLHRCHSNEVDIPSKLLEKASEYADTAIITIKRYSYENADRTVESFYLSDLENSLIEKITDKFKKTIVVLNVVSPISLFSLKNNDKINAMILTFPFGLEGGKAIAEAILGKINPSGKLVDTFASTYDAYPSSKTFKECDEYVDYTEDVYVGYRYFETFEKAKKDVVYQFGFGLSYTDFEISDIFASDNGKKIVVNVTATNIGKVSGKEVIEVYYKAPNGKILNPKLQLAGYKKTSLLNPGQSELLSIIFDISDMASYDDLGKLCKSAYVMEKGNYEIFVGNCIDNLSKADYTYSVLEDYIITKQLSEQCSPEKLKERLLGDGSFEKLPQTKTEFNYEKLSVCNKKAKDDLKTPLQLIDVYEKNVDMDEFLSQLTNEELVNLLVGQPNLGVANVRGMGNIERLGIPNIMTADGPAGVRIMLNTTAFPSSTMMACTWNDELSYNAGVAGGEEIKENNIGIWLAPGMNIHRDPLCGRNFEYYSEDPLISGKMAAAFVKGVQINGVAATIKHFICNNKEDNRFYSDSRVSERALREIYLKGFEIAIKEANPYALMTSYNKMNGRYASERYDLLTEILRKEWKYDGLVMSDWHNKAVDYLEQKAGNNVKMPEGNTNETLEKLKEGKISREELLASAKYLFEMFFKLD